MDRGHTPFDSADIETSIPEMFARRVRADPDRPAVACGAQTLSYDDLDRLSNRVAYAILRRRGGEAEPIALLFRQGLAAITATLGALKAGKIYVPLEPTEHPARLREVIAHCRPGLIIAERENEALAKDLTGASDRYLSFDAAAAGKLSDSPNLDLSPHRIAYIFYTSGTTGPPKGVFDSHRNVLHNVMRYTNSLAIGSADRLSLIQSCSFSGTVSSLFSALLNGAAVCPFDLQGKGIDRLAEWIESERITIFHSVPTIFERLIATGRTFRTLRLVRLEGDRAELRHIAQFQAHFGADCLLVNGLGATETGLVRQYFVTPKTKVQSNVVPIGHAVDGMHISLVGEDGRDVQQGEIGEIAVRSRYLACGYWQRPDLTAAAFVLDPADPALRTYRTGDLGRMRGDGCLEYVGRKDFRAKLRGQWIDTAAIELELCKIEGIGQALVLIRDDEFGVQHLVAYLVAADAQPPVDTMRRQLMQNLSEILIPSKYVFIAAMPLDRNGKIDRRALPVPKRQRPYLKQPFVAPASPEEEVVAACFCAVLRLDAVGVADDFLDLGGDSLLATELLVLIESTLKVKCPATLMARTFSVASLLNQLGCNESESALVPIRIGDSRPPLFCIHNKPGHVLEYYRLASLLDPDRTVYGLQSRAFTKAQLRDFWVEDMAAAYVREVTALQVDGPIHLCGNCFGGMIAFEMARQLRRQGRDVALVALIDTAFPNRLRHSLARRTRNEWRQLSEVAVRQWPFHVARRLGALVRRAALESRILLGAAAPQLSGTAADSSGPHYSEVLRRNDWAALHYRPRCYEGAITLICAGRLTNQRGWADVAVGGCNVIELPLEGQPERAPHLTREPLVGPLAVRINELLDD